MTRYSRSVSIARHSASLRTTSNSAADALRARTLAASAVERNDRRFMAVSLLHDRAPLDRGRGPTLSSARQKHRAHRMNHTGRLVGVRDRHTALIAALFPDMEGRPLHLNRKRVR